MDALHGRLLNVWRKSLTAITQECWELYRTSPGGNTTQNSSCTVTYHLSRKPSKLDEPDMWDTDGEVRTNFISDIPLWTPSHGRAKAGWPARTYTQQPCTDIGYSLDNLSGAMDYRDAWRERIREIRASSVRDDDHNTCIYDYIYIYIYSYIYK